MYRSEKLGNRYYRSPLAVITTLGRNLGFLRKLWSWNIQRWSYCTF